LGNRFSWLPKSLHPYVDGTLNSDMPRGRGELKYRTVPHYLDQSFAKSKYHIVFISYYATPSVIKKSIALRNTGRFYTTIIACCIREDLEILRWFDDAYEIEHYNELFKLLRGCSPWAVHVVIQPSLLGVIVLEIVKDTPIVIDINDSMLFIDRDKNSESCRLEREILARADAIVHKMPQEAITKIRNVWDIKSPDYLIHSLPARDVFTSQDIPYRSPFRLVYAGGIIPYHIAISQGHENHIFDPLILDTAEDGIKLTFFVNQNARNMFWHEHQHYFDLEKKFPHFHFKRGIPFFQLPEVLRKFHFGLLYDNVRDSSYRKEAFKYNMSTKVFSYLEAGLPILVYEEFEYIAKFIREHSVGIVYSLKRINEIRKLMENADYPKLKENVIKFREVNDISTIVPILKRVYGTTL